MLSKVTTQIELEEIEAIIKDRNEATVGLTLDLIRLLCDMNARIGALEEGLTEQQK